MSAATIPGEVAKRPDAWLDRPVFNFWPTFSIEKLVIILLIIITLFSRFYDLGERVMSHDEVNHVVPAYDLYQGRGYRYDPVTHGPLQFHMVAFYYFMLGDNDFSARVPAALFGVAVVLFTIFAWRRYLGRSGALIGGLLFAISPYMLFYSRYTRNEIFIVFWGLVMLWLMLRYFETGKAKFLIGLAAITGLHYADKATSYIFTAEALIFLAIFFIYEVIRKNWRKDHLKIPFYLLLVLCVLIASIGLIFYASQKSQTTPAEATKALLDLDLIIPLLLILAVVVLVAALALLVSGLGMDTIRTLRSFDLITLQLTLILPLLSALVLKLLGFDPLDYSQPGILRAAAVIVPMTLLSVFLGMLWHKRVWLKSAAIFWGIFIVFYSTFFTQGDGIFTGLLGALGYWMSQQTVQRGTQPLYYYAFVQIPIYEFLPALGTILALIIGLTKRLLICHGEAPFQRIESKATPDLEETLTPVESLEDDSMIDLNLQTEIALEKQSEFVQEPSTVPDPEIQPGELIETVPEEDLEPKRRSQFFTDPPDTTGEFRPVPTLFLLLFWSFISLVAFTLAGERMPWLTTHIALPLILSASWGLGYLVESTSWGELFKEKGVLVVLLCLVFLISFSAAMGSLLGSNPPFQGKELTQLQDTSKFLLPFLVSIGSLIGLTSFISKFRVNNILRLLLLSFFVLLGVITLRTSYRAAFINYDNAKEYLVYAHATRDMKDVLEQVETISSRLYGDKSIEVAYDNDSLYPFWWYFRDYPNKRWYADAPTKDLRNSPVILSGDGTVDKIVPVVADEYYQYNLKRMWWPMEDYRNQTISSVWNMVKNPAMRSALWQIWFNRDYKQYGDVTGKTYLNLAEWSPSAGLRMYIRKDVAAQIWEFGLSPEPVEPKVDPYAASTISLGADQVIAGVDELGFSAPRDIAIGPDGSLYIADSRNHRIVHLAADGSFIKAWGGYANVLDGPAPAGMFNEPWGVAVAQDGSVYVADTWNHRIQKFSKDGDFILLWDVFGSVETPDSFWGPRGLAIDSLGRVFVTDTGKQRVVIFDANGQYLSQFGGMGLFEGQMDEPVGIAIDADGFVYIADTWNYRIQIFAPMSDGLSYNSVRSWEVDAWSSQSLDNKPYLAVNAEKDIFVTDPSFGRILQFSYLGEFKQLWGGFDNEVLIGIANGIEIDSDGNVWVSDSLNNVLLRFNPPEINPASQGD